MKRNHSLIFFLFMLASLSPLKLVCGWKTVQNRKKKQLRKEKLRWQEWNRHLATNTRRRKNRQHIQCNELRQRNYNKESQFVIRCISEIRWNPENAKKKLMSCNNLYELLENNRNMEVQSVLHER